MTKPASTNKYNIDDGFSLGFVVGGATTSAWVVGACAVGDTPVSSVEGAVPVLMFRPY